MFGRFSVWILVLIAGGPRRGWSQSSQRIMDCGSRSCACGFTVSAGGPAGWRAQVSGPDWLRHVVEIRRLGERVAGVARALRAASVRDGRTGRGLRREVAAGTSITGVSNPVLLVYSHRPEVRERIMTAIGRRPAPDVGRVDYLECSAVYEVMMATQARAADVLILDGEAQPTGGIGISRQIHQEAAVIPPVVIVVRRDDDRWLATWAGADEILVHPLDPVTAADMHRRGCCAAGPPGWCRRSPTPLRGERREVLAGAADQAARRRAPGRGRHRLGDGPVDGRRGHAPPSWPASPWRCGPRARPPARSRVW